MVLSVSIGKRIKKLRLSKKLTQKQLGEKIGRSTESIKKYESGEITPPWSVVERIAEALNVPFNELVPDNSQKVRQRFFDVGYILKYRKEAYCNGHLLSDEERRRALDMLKLLFPEYQDDEE